MEESWAILNSSDEGPGPYPEPGPYLSEADTVMLGSPPGMKMGDK